jgi:hypothetical protein
MSCSLFVLVLDSPDGFFDYDYEYRFARFAVLFNFVC